MCGISPLQLFETRLDSLIVSGGGRKGWRQQRGRQAERVLRLPPLRHMLVLPMREFSVVNLVDLSKITPLTCKEDATIVWDIHSSVLTCSLLSVFSFDSLTAAVARQQLTPTYPFNIMYSKAELNNCHKGISVRWCVICLLLYVYSVMQNHLVWYHNNEDISHVSPPTCH